MKNQMHRIFHHTFRHNTQAIFNRRHKNIFLMRELSSSSTAQKQSIRQPEDHLLNHLISSCTFRHQQQLSHHALHRGVFLQHRGVHAAVHEHSTSSCSDISEVETSDQQQENYTNGGADNEIEVKHEGEPTRIKPSEERSKPSIYFLSGLDQHMAPITTKTIFMYKSSSKGNETSVEIVKNSLSKILSYYYPLAGKLRINSEGKFIVECTDEGVMFIEAKANCVMGDVLSRLDHPDTLLKLLYDAPEALEISIMTVQVTRFSCGGFAVGIAVNHSILDGMSEGEFLKNWGLIARGLPLDSPPVLDRTMLMTARPDIPAIPTHYGILQLKEVLKNDQSLYDDQPTVYKSFVFDEDMIKRLKTMAMQEAGSNQYYCSTFEVITAFVWRARTKAFGVNPNDKTRLLFSINVRSKLKPSLPKGFFGNGFVVTNSLCTAEDLLEKNFSYGVNLVQQAKSMVDEEYVQSYIDSFDPTLLVNQSIAKTLVISATNHLGFHETDFGWGEAIHIDPQLLTGKQVAMFHPHGSNNKATIVQLGLPRLAMNTFEQLVLQI